jgi:hypothetical protein
MSLAGSIASSWARRAAPGVRGLHTSAAALAAVCRKPAPAFKATAVVNEEFKNVSLADYKGQCEW